MAEERYRQYKLRSGEEYLVCWLRHGPALHVGRRLTLKDDERVWTIVERYATLLNSPPLKDWRVGGLV